MGEKENRSLSGVKEIARRAKVSIATVDRVIHNRKGVSEATKNRINEIIEEIGFQPNILASRLASKKTNRFLVIIPQSVEAEYWNAILNGINRAYQEIRQYGIVVDCLFYDLNEKQSFVQVTDKLTLSVYDGILLAPSFFDEVTSFTAICREENIPYVFINSDIPGEPSLAYIGPNLFKSGYLAGKLISFGLKKGKVLIVNISKEIDAYHHLLRKEEGFRAYFQDQQPNSIELFKIDIRNTLETTIEQELDAFFRLNQKADAIFVTNSRVRFVANYLTKNRLNAILIGYDFIGENIEYLKSGSIDFLIGQKPEQQGYIGIMSLFQYVVKGEGISKENFMPIDIIAKENYEFYKN